MAGGAAALKSLRSGRVAERIRVLTFYHFVPNTERYHKSVVRSGHMRLLRNNRIEAKPGARCKTGWASRQNRFRSQWVHPVNSRFPSASVVLIFGIMNLTARYLSLVFAFGSVLTTGLLAQTPKVDFPAASPTATLKQHVGLTDIEIVYSRPSVKGRVIFGGLVPYNAIWRTGANASTKISFSTPVKLNGNTIPAGKYSLYTIPSEQEWTIIVSKDTAGNIFNYNATNDLVRFKVTPVQFTDTSIETFVIEFNHIRDESAVINLAWDKTVVPIKLELDVASKVIPQIEAAMASTEKKDAGFYYQSAMFYFNHDLDLKKALSWLDTGLTDKPRIAYELLNLKARILAKQGDKDGAIAAAKESTELALKAEGPSSSFARMNQDLISSLH
jgi:hypothetical protein